jgi:hypothetical protein
MSPFPSYVGHTNIPLVALSKSTGDIMCRTGNTLNDALAQSTRLSFLCHQGRLDKRALPHGNGKLVDIKTVCPLVLEPSFISAMFTFAAGLGYYLEIRSVLQFTTAERICRLRELDCP